MTAAALVCAFSRIAKDGPVDRFQPSPFWRIEGRGRRCRVAWRPMERVGRRRAKLDCASYVIRISFDMQLLRFRTPRAGMKEVPDIGHSRIFLYIRGALPAPAAWGKARAADPGRRSRFTEMLPFATRFREYFVPPRREQRMAMCPGEAQCLKHRNRLGGSTC